MNARRRIGMLGGAFDPPHAAHVALAQCAVAQFDLDALHLIPTGDAWHKTRTLTAAAHRLAMTRLAFADTARVVVDAREIERAGPSYTVDTLQELRAEYPSADLFVFIGADQAQAFQTWHRWRDILALATVVVADRAGRSAIEPRAQWHNAVSPEVQRLDMPRLNVSATELRAALQSPKVLFSLAPLAHLPAAVQHYIEQHSLYRTSP